MRVNDLEAWKNVFDDCNSILNGEHSLNWSLCKNPSIKAEQLSVIFPLKPRSNGDGKGEGASFALAVCNAADEVFVPAVPLDACVDDGTVAVVNIDDDDDDEESSSSSFCRATFLFWFGVSLEIGGSRR
jgi:hypothetical protein